MKSQTGRRITRPCIAVAGILLASGTAQLTSASAQTTAETFPKQNPTQAFAELKVLGTNGNPIRMPVDDWDGAKRRVASDPAWGKWLTERRTDMDDWMAKRQDHVEWMAGWWHDFVSPKDGSFLTFTPDEPGEETLRSPSDPKVKLTPKLRAAWVYSFRTSHANHMVTAAQLYKLTSEKKYADWAAAQLDFYADNFSKWPTEGPLARKIAAGQPRGSHLMWQSLDEAVDLIKYVNTARFLGDYVTPERKQMWFTKLFKPECEILLQSFSQIHNISCWHHAAIGCVAVYYQDPGLWNSAVEAKYGIKDQLARGVTSDYLWYEQSLGYNSYVVMALLPFFEFASLSGDAPKLQQEMDIAENLMLAPIAMRFPSGRLPNPADGKVGNAPDTGLLASAARLFPTTIGAATRAKKYDWDTLLDPPTASTATPILTPVVSRNMESSQMAILRKGPWQVYFHFGQLTSSHSQAEALNYEAFYEKTDITHDPGTVGYGSPLHKGFYATGIVHNVPLIDGIGQEGWSKGKLLQFDGTKAQVSAIQPTYRKNASAERTLTIDGNRLTDTLTVKTTDNMPHELGTLVQIQGKAILPSTFQPDTSLTQPGQPAPFTHWKEITSATFTDSASFVVTFSDGRKQKIEFSLPGTFTVTHATAPDYPPGERETFYIRKRGTDAVFKTVFSPE
jgi:hypothetical protein